MGNRKALYTVPKEFTYYGQTKEGLKVGRGLRAKMREHALSANIPIFEEDLTVAPPTSKPIKTNIKLRDYQYGIIEEINPQENHEGILRCDTGWGKTVLALLIAEACQTRTLIIVPRLHLLEQFTDSVRKFTGREPGVIQGNTEDIRDITIASLQTLRRRNTHGKLRGQFGLVIVDEAHQSVPIATRRVIQSFNPRFLYGLTATARRTDEQSEAIRFTFGPTLCDRKLEKHKPSVEFLEFHGRIPVWEYAEMITNQIENYDRNQLIVNRIKEEVGKGRRVLVLTKRIDHYKHLASRLATETPKLQLETVNSSSNKKALAKQIEDLRSGASGFDCLLGTYSMLSTGLDIPRLDTLAIVGDLKSDVLTEQSAGRILRLFEGKKNPKIIDVWDKANPILKRQGYARQQFYREQGWM